MAMHNSLRRPNNNTVSTAESVNIVTYNMHGFNQGIVLLNSLCDYDNYDVIYIQEHWLSPDLLNNFDYFKNNYLIFCSSSMSTSLSHSILRGRPFGGLCILISKLFANKFNTIDCIACSDRCIIVALDKLLLVNVYLPSCRSNVEQDELCSVIDTVVDKIVEVNSLYTILGGDLNCNVELRSAAANIINSRLTALGLLHASDTIIPRPVIDYTFAVESRNAYSSIDNFYISQSLANYSLDLKVLHDSVNFSDHLPLHLVLNSNIIGTCKNVSSLNPVVTVKNKLVNARLDWKKDKNN